MISVQLYVDNRTNDIVFKVSGHAGCAPFGKDTICAVATGYAKQMSIIAKVLYTEGKLLKRPRISEESGKVTIVMRPRSFNRFAITLYQIEYAQIVSELRTVISGYDWLQEKYPEYVKIIEFDNAKA